MASLIYSKAVYKEGLYYNKKIIISYYKFYNIKDIGLHEIGLCTSTRWSLGTWQYY